MPENCTPSTHIVPVKHYLVTTGAQEATVYDATCTLVNVVTWLNQHPELSRCWIYVVNPHPATPQERLTYAFRWSGFLQHPDARI